MLLDSLEHKYKHTKDFHVLEKSFQNDEPKIDCPNIKHSITNILTSDSPCVIRWALFRKCPSDIKSYEQELLNLLNNDDLYIRYKSCQLLTKLYESETPSNEYLDFFKIRLKRSQTYEEINQLLFFICEMLPNRRHSMKIIGKTIFDRNVVKIRFAEDRTFMNLLRMYLRIDEVQYYALKAFWILSFNRKCLKIIEESKILLKIIDLMKERSRDKLTRLGLSIVRKCLERKIKFSITLSYDLVAFCDQKFDDEDMINDAIFIKTTLTEILRNTSEIKCYLKELLTGKSEDAPYHFEDKFWKSNHDTLLENKIEVIKALKRNLSSKDTRKICLAANDVFHLLKIDPEFGLLVIRSGIKDDLFVLCDSKHPDIRFNALQAVASCIVFDWDTEKKDKKKE